MRGLNSYVHLHIENMLLYPVCISEIENDYELKHCYLCLKCLEEYLSKGEYCREIKTIYLLS